MRIRPLLFALTLFGAAAFPDHALASASIAGGGIAQSDSAGASAILSSGASIPAVPLELQGSLLIPLTSPGGYAATAEIRGFTGGGYGGAYIGAGAGIGTLSTDRSGGTLFTVFAGKSIAPQTSLEIRLYKQLEDSGAAAGFIGVRFSF